MNDTAHTYSRKRCIDHRCKCRYSSVKQLLQICSDKSEGQIEDRSHYQNKHRNSGKTSGQHTVYPAAANVLATLTRTHNGITAECGNKRKTHIGYCSSTVKPTLSFHLHNDMLYHLALVLAQIQRRLYTCISLDELACRKAHRNTRSGGMILDKMHYSVQAAMHRTAVLIL